MYNKHDMTIQMPDMSPFKAAGASNERPLTKDEIGKQLDEFAAANGIKSLRDRLRIGLNESAILAIDQFRTRLKGICRKLAADDREADEIYSNLETMVVDIQSHGPWDYARDLAQGESPEIKAFFILNGITTIGYEKERDLNDQDFQDQFGRILSSFDRAAEDPEKYYMEAREHALEMAASTIRLMHRKDEKGKDVEEPEEKLVARGEGLGAFLPMALMGRKVGVVKDDEGWVYVGADGMISDRLIETCGLKRKLVKDPRDPTRQVTMFVNSEGTEVVKKVHRGLLVILNSNYELARAIAAAYQEEREVIEVADSAIGHLHIHQTTEKKHISDEKADREHWERKRFLRRRKESRPTSEQTESRALLSLREQFYESMLEIRAYYVYLDALEAVRRQRRLAAIMQLEKEAKKKNREVTQDEIDAINVVLTEHDREVASEETWDKMKDKVEELRCLNGIVSELLPQIPEGVHSVVDMAGGAGDVGLAVSNELILQGREINDVEIVDPQPGISDFFDNIVDYLPLRDRLIGRVRKEGYDPKKKRWTGRTYEQPVAHHNGGMLQDANLKPDTIVVAKHACGTLMDDMIQRFISSESPMLIAMTCCQDKAAGEASRYGMSQEHWDHVCVTSALTNTKVPDQPGKAREIAQRKLEEGQRAMLELDMARVEYLRRHGFKAELRLNPQFPKGDVIIARRLPKDFMGKLQELRELEKTDPLRFEAILQRLDGMARGRKYRGQDAVDFGEGWIADDFDELRQRLEPAYEANRREAALKMARQAVEDYQAKLRAKWEARLKEHEAAEKKAKKERAEAFHKAIFADAGGKPNTYLEKRTRETGKPIPKQEIGGVIGIINALIQENADRQPAEIRSLIDAKLDELGY